MVKGHLKWSTVAHGRMDLSLVGKHYRFRATNCVVIGIFKSCVVYGKTVESWSEPEPLFQISK